MIVQLGSPRFAEREAASEALERLGQDAFPVLREARKDRDPEVRNRAEVLLDSIERTMLTRPTSITFAGGSQPVSRLVDELSRAEGVPIPLAEGDATAVVVMKPATLPFWKAIDAMGLASKWEADAEADRFGNRREETFRLAPRPGPAGVVSDSGPFRIAITRPPSFELLDMGHLPPMGWRSGTSRPWSSAGNPRRAPTWYADHRADQDP